MRSSPTPSAPSSTAAGAPSMSPRLANDLDARAVQRHGGLGGVLERDGVARVGALRTARRWRSAAAGSGSTRHGARVAVEQERRALGDGQQRGPSPTTVGTPSERAMIAAWPVAPPCAVAIAGDRLGIERRGVARQQLVGRRARRRRRPRRSSLPSERRAATRRPTSRDVRGALAQVGVVEALVPGGDVLGRVVDGARGVVALVGDRRGGRVRAARRRRAARAGPRRSPPRRRRPRSTRSSRAAREVARATCGERVVEPRRLGRRVLGVARRGRPARRRSAAAGRSAKPGEAGDALQQRRRRRAPRPVSGPGGAVAAAHRQARSEASASRPRSPSSASARTAVEDRVGVAARDACTAACGRRGRRAARRR